MSALIPFEFEGRQVRIIERDGEPWFVGGDVCAVLGLANSRDALGKLDADERGVGSTDTLGGEQKVAIISEGGLYTLILRSRDATKPGTIPHRFRKWVTGEVLPTIRRTGSYSVRPAPAIDVRDPAQLAAIATQLIDMNRELSARVETAERAVAVAAPKAEFFDRFANTEGLYGLQNAARALGQPPQRFIDGLKKDCLFYQGGSLVPRAPFANRGLFMVRPVMNSEKARYQTFVTPKGLQWLAGRIPKPLAALPPPGDLFGSVAGP